LARLPGHKKFLLVHCQDDRILMNWTSNVYRTVVDRNDDEEFFVLAEPALLSDSNSGVQRFPAAGFGTDDFFAAWESDGVIRGRSVAATGTLGAEVTLFANGSLPSLALVGANVLVTQPGDEWLGQVVSPVGAPKGATFSGGDGGWMGSSPTAAPLPGYEGRFAVAWQRILLSTGTILAQRLDRDPVSGAITQQAARQLPTSTNRALNPALAASTPGGPVLVVWEEDQADGSSWGIMARLVTF